MPQTTEIRIQHAEMESIFRDVLLKHGFSNDKAQLISGIFADNSLDGVYTHGVNRFPRFIQMVQQGHIAPLAEPVKISGLGALEQWDGNIGAGPSNAVFCTQRAIQLSQDNGIGCVALANTNHWMRGGTYGWQAARQGFAFLCWTNTIANMSAWGAKDSRLGNNPLIMAVPKDGEAVVLDMAISQFSFGAIERSAMQQKELPVPGGYDQAGQMTTNPKKILETERGLPIGYWKGSGLSLLLDLLATVLSGGRSTFEITASKVEAAVSQVFIAINLSTLHNSSAINSIINNIVADYHNASPDASQNKILYPGERVMQTRQENREEGIPVNKTVWDNILALM